MGSRRSRLGVLLVVLAMVLVLVPAAAGTGVTPAVAGTGSISGTVTEDGTGDPVSSIRVEVRSVGYGSALEAFPASDGTYMVSGLSPGEYRVLFTDSSKKEGESSGIYVDEWFNDKPDPWLADVVSVTAGATTVGVDASLAVGGAIAGVVTADGSGDPLSWMEVCAYQRERAPVECAESDVDGSYSINGLAASYYRVSFAHLDFDPVVYAREWYNDAPDWESADVVAVSLGLTTSGVDAALALGGTISGTVTGAGGVLVDGVVVNAYAADTGYLAAARWVDGAGNYSLEGLVAGEYKVGFSLEDSSLSEGYLPEFYADKPDLVSADTVAVTAGGTTSGIDAELATAGHISGTVTGSGGVPLTNVDVLVWDGATSVAYASVDLSGTYAIGGLATGEYTVSFWDGHGAYVGEFYSDKPDRGSSDAVPVTAGSTTSGIDAELATAGHISGTVTGSGGVPLETVRMYVFDASTGDRAPIPYDFTDSAGAYALGGLPAGEYRVLFEDPSGLYQPEWYDGQGGFGAGDAVVVSAGVTTSGVDAELALAPTVARVWGTSRFDTAASVALSTLPATGGRVYVANGLGFADALAGGPVAGRFNDPLLLVRSGSIPPETAAALAALRPSEIVILGGSVVISDAVATALGAYAATVTRIAGSDRFATAVQVSKAQFKSHSPGVVYLAYGLNFPDALAGTPAAIKDRAPLLLTRSTFLPPVTADELVRLGPSEVVLLGGSVVIDDAVADQVRSLLPGVTVTRLAGTSRFGTAVAVSRRMYPSGGARVVYVANAFGFPDALAGGPAAGSQAGPLLLVRSDSIPAETEAEILRLAPQRVVILGGAAVISDSVKTQLEALVAP